MTPRSALDHPVRRLEEELAHVRRLLEYDAFFSLSEEEKEELRKRAEGLGHKLADVESGFLTVGLLGGTGVGKSTIMNALAGAEIASTSDRRPHTDRVLIYRHMEAPGIPVTPEETPWKEITHGNDRVRQILLCDLPDFDSLMGSHREDVLRFLSHLDVLVWVTSPEKYADARFYELLGAVQKARRNFYFVLNKGDILFEGEGPAEGYGRLDAVAGSFLGHIREHGVEEPILFTLSAEEALRAAQQARWNQFSLFRQQIFQQRDMKQVMAIKSANLDVEVQQILSSLEREILTLGAYEKVLDTATGELRAERPRWMQTGKEAVELWMGRIDRDVLAQRTDPSVLIGPGYAFALVFLEWEKRSSSERPPQSDRLPFLFPDEVALLFQKRLEWVEDRIHHQVLRKNLPGSLRDSLKEILHVPRTTRDLRERFAALFALKTARPPLLSLWRFKGVQLFFYLLFLALFLLTLGGENGWRTAVENPGFHTASRLFLSIFYALFSATGLAALVSYALLNLFLGFRFFRRYRGILHRSTGRALQSLRKELEGQWENELDRILEDLERLRAEIRKRISEFSKIGG